MRVSLLARPRLAIMAAVAALGASAVVLVSTPEASAQEPQQVTFGLEGCAITEGTTLPIDGRFVCPDSMYSRGSLGSNWSELDLVPYRLIADNAGPAQTYTVSIAGDYERAGVRGFDVVSEPAVNLNAGLSDPGCLPPQVGPQQVRRPGLGGADASVFRNLTITQAAGQHCVYDYTLRLALGSSDIPGGSLSGRFGNENFTSTNQNVGIQVSQLDPQQLSKTIQASRGDGFLWTVNKSSLPSELGVDTCDDDPTAQFTSTITWTRTPVTGDVSWTSTIVASNPSTRNLVIEVVDRVRADGVEIDVTEGDQALLPAGAVNHLVMTHSGTAPPGTQTVSDTATATYVDTVTDQPIPQQTTATASTTVTQSPPGNSTAQITDVTTSSGPPMSIDSVSTGTADTALGTPVPGPITWNSGTVNSSGTATLTFSAYLTEAFGGEATISDTATLVDENGETQTAGATVTVHGNPADPMITFVKTVDVPPTEDATFRFAVWFAGQDPATDPPIISGPVTIPAGQTQSQSVTIDLPPSPDGYIYVEEPAPGYVGTGDGTIDPLGPCDVLEAEVGNERQTGAIQIQKVIDGPVAGAETSFTVHLDCEGDTFDQDVVLTVPDGATEVTETVTGIPTGLTCAVTEPGVPAGWTLTSIEPGTLTVDDDAAVDVTVTNTRVTGDLVVTKVIEGDPAGATTTFPVEVDCDGTEYDSTFELTVPAGATQVSSDPIPVPVGVSCTVRESPVPAGWGLIRITPDGGTVTITTGSNEVTITDTRLTGSLIVTKQANGYPGGAGTVFTVHVSCPAAGFEQDVMLDVVGDGGASQLVGPIASGVTCTVTEPDTGVPDGWTLASIEPNNGVVVIGDDPAVPASVTVTNERTLGAIQIQKMIDGPVAGAATSFTVDLDCEGDQFDQQVTLTVPDGATTVTETVTGIPTGVECTVTEAGVPDGWTLTSIEPGTLTVDDDPAVDITVTNTRNRGEITIVKRLVGPVAGADTTFTLALDCDDDQFDQEVQLEVTDGESASVTITGIPTGVICTLTEPMASDGWMLAGIAPAQVTVGSDPNGRLVAVNRRELGGLEIYKVLLGPVDGAPTTFSALLDCDGTAFDQEVVIEVRSGVISRTVIRGIPTGVTCTATEVQVPDQWILGGVASDTVTITDTELITVHAVNTRVTGELTVVKAIRGRPPDTPTAFDLAMDCSDDLFDIAVPVDVPAGATTVREPFSGIPTGVTCSVSERSLPNGWELVSIQPAQATITAAQPAVLTVVNRAAPTDDDGPPDEGPRDDGPPPPDAGGELPDTGAPLTLWALVVLLAMGGVLIIAGTVLLYRSRREPPSSATL